MGINAQTSVPKFTAGDTLTAANTNLLANGIPVFGGTATRDAAFDGAAEKALAQGQFAYLEDTNTTQVYDGSAWVGAVNNASLNGIGSYTAYTPTFTNLTVGNGTSSFAYAQVNKMVHVIGTFTFGTTSAITGLGPGISLPFTRAAATNPILGVGSYSDAAVATYNAFLLSLTTTEVNLFAHTATGTYVSEVPVNTTVPFIWGNLDIIMINLIYRAA
jgi:hypothetical protein